MVRMTHLLLILNCIGLVGVKILSYFVTKFRAKNQMCFLRYEICFSLIIKFHQKGKYCYEKNVVR